MMRAYTSMWVASIAYGINAVVQPWKDSKLSKLENASLMTIASTFNLALVLNHTSEDTWAALYYIVISLIIGMNLAMLIAFLLAAVAEGRETALNLAERNPKRFGWINDFVIGHNYKQAEKNIAQQ